ERQERERTGIRTLKVGYNKVFGYYIEVTKPNLDAVPKDYVRKQTLVNAERFITPELKEQESLILNAEERRDELERQIYGQVLTQVSSYAGRIAATAQAIAAIDVSAALAEVAQRNRYVRPTLNDSETVRIVGGRHPVVELMLHDEPFVPNDTLLSPQETILVITGPNMSGKSTYLRQVALIVLMAQIGSFVPATSAEIGLVDRIFTRVGAQDEISAGQSTFMVEMVETANILNHATGKSLLILDEIGRGTSTYDGISIAWAVVEYIHNHPRLQAKTLFATHYHELIELARFLPRIRNFNVAVAEEGDRVVFLRRIVPGGADRSYGIHVAQMAGLPRTVVHRAEEILHNLEQELQRSPAGSLPRRVSEAQQLPLFETGSPALEELRELDVSAMSPLEAINKLFELQGLAKRQQSR
ncbi:MAG TPA: DNA mismatch repair protein MutS, partial [Anaerolineae bacterium]|nr:DNA mismatch repair protein MutS [Anaerolineae bacterium]